MKKLMIIAAVAMTAIGAQAATVTWGFSEQIKGEPNYSAAVDFSDYTAYLFEATTWDNNLATLGAEILNAKYYADMKAFTKSSIVASKSTMQFVTLDTSPSGLAAGKDYYIILSDGENYWQSDKFLSGNFSEWGDDDPAPTTVDKLAVQIRTVDSPITSLTGQFTAAPEPTSAMLLLLGVAGLALKRKHA